LSYTTLKATTDFGDLLFYESEWGVFLTSIAALLQFAAVLDKKLFNEAAVITQEISMCLNIIITPAFWILFAKITFENIPHTKDGYYLIFLYSAHHIFPIISSAGNLWIHKQYFLRKDSKIVWLAGFIYIWVNYAGTKITGHPVYPWAFDWSHPIESFLIYFTQCFILYWI
jgi:hypothetical protein